MSVPAPLPRRRAGSLAGGMAFAVGALTWWLAAPPAATAATEAPPRPTPAVPRAVQTPAPQPAAPPRRVPVAVHAALLAAAIALWLLALDRVDLSGLAGFGLLDVLPLPYFVALAVLLGGFLAEMAHRRPRPLVLAAYVGALIAVMHATTAVLYDEPRYAWTYKHLGVIDYIAAHGSVDRHIDIYQNWPGFFALTAWFSRVAGVAPLEFANWAQPFFGVAFAAVVLFAVRGVTRDVRLQWGAVWLFVLANWVGQDYLAPQSLGFVLVTALFGVCLRAAPVRGPGADRVRLPLPGAVAAALGGVCFAAAVMSHQLSPVIGLLGVGAIALFARRIPLWALGAMALAEAGWLALSWSYLTRNYALFVFDPWASPRPTGYDPADGLPGLELVTAACLVTVGVMVLLAVAGLVRRRRAGRRDRAPLALAVAPVTVLVLQSYGGEATLRIFLFALPWLAFLAAAACAPPARARAARRIWPLGAATLLVAVCALPAYFGREAMNHIPSGDVQAALWYERNAPDNSSLAYLAPNFPNRLTADYARVRVTANQYEPALTEEPQFRGHPLGAADVPRMADYLRGLRPRNVFLSVSRSEEEFLQLYGVVPGGLGPLERALERSREFRVVYRDDTATLFELRDALGRP